MRLFSSRLTMCWMREKAALAMREAGVEHVYQLEGGILKYFEETEGAPHWRGDCFVFDERIAVDTALAPA